MTAKKITSKIAWAFVALCVIAAAAYGVYRYTAKDDKGVRSIAIVNCMMTDSLAKMQSLTALSGQVSGTIALIGDPASCLKVGEKMLISDEFDNIDASLAPDGLPDFAGETIVPFLDFANYPYEDLMATEHGTALLREIAVKNALEAMDTLGRCKVIVICSPVLAKFGASDIEDLFTRAECHVPLVYSQDTTFSFTQACFRVMREKKLFTHSISYPSARLNMTVAAGVSPASFTSVKFEDRYVPASYPDTVGVVAPNTYHSHVLSD